MKYYYKKPEMNKIEFAANEYIAACYSAQDGFTYVACDGGNGSGEPKHGFALDSSDLYIIRTLGEGKYMNVTFCGYPGCSQEVDGNQDINVTGGNKVSDDKRADYEFIEVSYAGYSHDDRPVFSTGTTTGTGGCGGSISGDNSYTDYTAAS